MMGAEMSDNSTSYKGPKGTNPVVPSWMDDGCTMKVCPSCKGNGTQADYVGLEMRCVAVECDRCKGTGEVLK